MGGIDNLIANSLGRQICNELGPNYWDKILGEISSLYGYTISEAIRINYGIVENILSKFFGSEGARTIEQKCFDQIMSHNYKVKNNKSYLIIDGQIKNLIISTYGDSNKMMILNNIKNEPKSLQDLFTHCNIPSTSFYRKVNSLIKNGVLVKSKQGLKWEGSKVNRYHSLLHGLRINIIKNKVNVTITISPEIEEESRVIQALHSG